MRGFLIALQFLTVLPVRLKEKVSDRQLAESMAYFPLVGLLIGTALAFFYNVFNLFLPHPVNCAFILIISALITGGLHLDGFIDTFDALASRADRKRKLEIMREGRPGAIGTASAILLFIAKYSLLVSLPHGTIEISLVMMAALSRWSLVFSTALYPYAREGEGVARGFIKDMRRRELLIASAIALLAASLVFRTHIFILIPVICSAVLAFNYYLYKILGGITGDTLGALNEIIEALTLAFMVVLI